MGKPLDIAAAELSLKENVVKTLKKVDKSMDKSAKKLVKNEKLTKKNARTNLKLAKSQKEIAKAQRKLNEVKARAQRQARGRIGRRAASGGRAVGRGAKRGVKAGTGALGAFTGGIGGIPIVGGAIAAILGAIAATRTNFIAGVALQKSLIVESQNFKAAFSSKASQAIIAREKSSLFRSRDTQQGLTSLRDRGIGTKALGGGQRTLARFAKSQGFASLTEGINALTSGAIKAGRGINTVDIKKIQAIAPLLNDVSTSAKGFQLIVEILKKSKIKKTADRFGKGIKRISRQSNLIADDTERTTKAGANAKGAETAFLVAGQAQRATNKAVAKIAKVSGKTVAKSIKTAGEFIEDPAKVAKKGLNNAIDGVKSFFGFGGDKKKGKALGGRISKEPTLVGERGPELFTPGTSGSILPNHRLQRSAERTAPSVKKMATVNMNPTFNLTINGSQDAPQEIASQVQQQLDQMVNSMRFELGMALQG